MRLRPDSVRKGLAGLVMLAAVSCGPLGGAGVPDTAATDGSEGIPPAAASSGSVPAAPGLATSGAAEPLVTICRGVENPLADDLCRAFNARIAARAGSGRKVIAATGPLPKNGLVVALDMATVEASRAVARLVWWTRTNGRDGPHVTEPTLELAIMDRDLSADLIAGLADALLAFSDAPM